MKMNPNFYLFVDDERDPSFLRGAYPKVKHGAVFLPPSDKFLIARTVEEAKELIEHFQYPSVVCMDNDLGDGQTEGYEFVRWLLAQDDEFNWMTPEFIWVVHSMNPINAKKMMQDFDDHYYRKFRRY